MLMWREDAKSGTSAGLDEDGPSFALMELFLVKEISRVSGGLIGTAMIQKITLMETVSFIRDKKIVGGAKSKMKEVMYCHHQLSQPILLDLYFLCYLSLIFLRKNLRRIHLNQLQHQLYMELQDCQGEEEEKSREEEEELFSNKHLDLFI